MSSAAALLTVLGVAQRFDPRTSLFGHFEPGFDYDFSDRSTLFQDTAGTTPVTGVEQTVALILDKSRGLVLGSELVTNGAFDANLNGWTLSGTTLPTWSPSGITLASDGSFFSRARQSFTTSVGRAYRLTFDVVAPAGSLVVDIGTSAGASDVLTTGNLTTAGSRTYVFFAQSTTTHIELENGSVAAPAPVLDNVSVRELPGLHQIQSTAASRAVLRSRYNLLTYSEDFSNAAWTNTRASISANAATAPDGTTTADKLVEDSTASNSHLTFNATVLSVANTTSYTYSIYAKPAGRNWLALVPSFSAGSAYFDIQNGVLGTVSNGAASITPVGDGWYLCRLTVTSNSTSGYLFTQLASANGTNSYTGDGTSGIFIWGADLRPANDTIYPYQRITDAATYATGPQWPTYLEYDGVDDSYVSAANLDLSGTDKLTVFAAVTKLSDAAVGIVCETSADASGANNGAFYLSAPNAAAATNYVVGAQGTVFTSATATATAPTTSVVTGAVNISAPSNQIRLNGAVAATNSASLGTGNFGSYPLFLGRRNNASLPFRGRMYRVIGRGAATPVATISQCERFLARQAGITL